MEIIYIYFPICSLIVFAFSKLLCLGSQGVVLEGFICSTALELCESTVHTALPLTKYPKSVQCNKYCWALGSVRCCEGVVFRGLSALTFKCPSTQIMMLSFISSSFPGGALKSKSPTMAVCPLVWEDIDVFNVKRCQHLPIFGEENFFVGLWW